MADPTWRRGFAQLQPLGLTYDALLFHTQIPELINLATAFPQTLIVLNHVGCPIGVGPYAGKRYEYSHWSKSMRESSPHNVTVKLGRLSLHKWLADKRKTPPTRRNSLTPGGHGKPSDRHVRSRPAMFEATFRSTRSGTYW
jgi:hypothetical protein